MLEKTFHATLYLPTQPRTGDLQPTLLRLGNAIITGQNGLFYIECHKGSLDMGETIPTDPLTGTIDITADSVEVVGTGTLFSSELRSGQRFYVGDFMLIVDQITDDEHCTVYVAPDSNVTAATAERAPVIYEIQGQRGTQISGRSVESDKGSVIGAGFGTVRINGEVLPGDSLVLDGAPLIAVFNQTTGLYDVYDLNPGMQPPTTSPTTSSVSGGEHNMQPGNFSARLVPARTETNGYTNPGPQIPYTITTPGDKAELDFSGGPAMYTAAGQNAWDVYSSENIDSIPVYVQGPWNYVKTVTQQELTDAGDKIYLDFANAEINRLGLLDFNNNPPPPCGYVAFLEGGPVWISCRGKLSDTFGPSIRPAKPRNVEAAPADWDVTSTPPQNILGVTSSLARLYFPTPASLQQGIYLGSTDPFQIVPPVSMRSYWRVGFNHENQLIFSGQDLYGCPHQGPTRSVADAEKVSEQYFGQQVVEIMKSWNQAYIFVGEDPQLDAACFFHSMDSQNDAGFWRTRVLIWGFEQNGWIGDVFIESDDRDMNVCSVHAVGEHLYFLAGGRLDAGIQVDTFKFNAATGPTNWYAAFSGISHPSQNLSVRAGRATGKMTEGVFQVHGWDEDENIDYDALEAGDNPLIEIPMSSTGIARKFRERFNAPNCGLAIPRVSGTWDGTGEPDRVDQVYLAGMPTGNRR